MIALSGLYSTGHLGIPPPALTEAISWLPIAHEAFTFVDIGCGKGRALMVASAFPFRRLVGVEISPELCEIARANTARRPEWPSPCIAQILALDAVLPLSEANPCKPQRKEN